MTTQSPPASLRAAEFVGEHQRGLWRWLRAIGCASDAADEHCQDALLAAFHHGVDAWPTADASRWLRTAARNLFWMQLRRERRRPQHVPLAAIEADWLRLRGDDDGLEHALRELTACVQSLPARDRELIALRYADDLGRPAIAARLGLGEAGVKQALRRLRERLRRCVETKLDGDAPTMHTLRAPHTLRAKDEP